MANPEHVKVLLQGVAVWNNWLVDQWKKDPDFRADLSGFDLWSKEAQESALFVAKSDTSERVPDLSAVQFFNVSLEQAYLAEADLIEAHLEGADLSFAHFEKANLGGAHFNGAILGETRFNDGFLLGAHFKGALSKRLHSERGILLAPHFEGATLQGAHFESAHFPRAHFEKADLRWAHFENAHISKANFESADLWGAHFEGVDLRGANLSNANVTGVHFNRWGKYQGSRLDGCYGSQRFVRHAKDQDFLEELRGWNGDMRPWKWNWRFWEKAWWDRKKFEGMTWRFWLIYLPWLVIADCGRSFWLWLTWSVGLAWFFAEKYLAIWQKAQAAFHFSSKLDVVGAANMFKVFLYYSVVTFTTLGFGDVTPLSEEARFWVMLEVIAGYVMLGGLISIMATKFFRRSG